MVERLTVVVPLFNEEAVFPLFCQQLFATLNSLDFSSHVVFVDDGSSDQTPRLIQDLARNDDRVSAVLLTRNFGHQAAVSAGIDHARGDVLVIMDGDLQDPPGIIPELIREYLQGHDVVIAARRSRKGRVGKRICYWLYYRLLCFVLRVPIPPDAGDFCLLSKRAYRAIAALPERRRFLRGLRAWVGFRQKVILFDRNDRHAGEPGYSLAKLIHLALDGIFSMTEVPIRFISVIGLVVSLFSFLWGVYLIAWRFLAAEPLAGFSTLACAIFFLGGIQLVFLGIIGEYIARIHSEVKGRPIYIVHEKIGFSDQDVQALDATG